MRMLAVVFLLGLSACGPNSDAVIRDICIPNNESENFDVEKVAKEKGYDIQDVQEICRKWYHEGLKEFSRRAREVTGGSDDPSKKAD